jgi:hypothetical protein
VQESDKASSDKQIIFESFEQKKKFTCSFSLYSSFQYNIEKFLSHLQFKWTIKNNLILNKSVDFLYDSTKFNGTYVIKEELITSRIHYIDFSPKILTESKLFNSNYTESLTIEFTKLSRLYVDLRNSEIKCSLDLKNNYLYIDPGVHLDTLEQTWHMSTHCKLFHIV